MNIQISPLSLLRGTFFRPQKVVGCVIAAVLVVVIGVVVIGVGIFFSYQRQQRLGRLTAEAPAQVSAVRVVSSKLNSNDTSRRYATIIAYSFEANGRTIETEWTKGDDVSDEFAVGQRAKVCYDPGHPEDNEIFTLSYRCGQ